MLRSMYSAVSGMKGFQTKLDVIGNNIANVNTTGFKAGRVMFADLLSQTIAGGSTPANNLGGTNPRQIGLGSRVSSIDTLFTDGSLQPTNVPTDLAIQGNGFFVLTGPGGDNDLYYTRAGNFTLDRDGYLVASNGYKVYGQTSAIPSDAQSFSISADGTIQYVDNSGNTTSAGQIQLATFSNPAGLKKIGSNLYKFDVNANDGEPTPVNPGTNGAGQLAVGFLEMSNVDMANEFTEMITAERGFQANSRVITTSDNILQELVNLVK